MSGISSKVVKEILIPEIEKEVNQGKHFANLRQIYHAVILAAWYKGNLKSSLLGQVYADKNKIKGVDVEDKAIKEKIYEQYLTAFKKGVYNYIRQDVDPATQEVVPRKYFSGGVQLSLAVKTLTIESREDLQRLPAYVQEAFASSSPIVSMTADMMENQGPATAGDIASAVIASSPVKGDVKELAVPSANKSSTRNPRIRVLEILLKFPPRLIKVNDLAGVINIDFGESTISPQMIIGYDKTKDETAYVLTTAAGIFQFQEKGDQLGKYRDNTGPWLSDQLVDVFLAMIKMEKEKNYKSTSSPARCGNTDSYS